MLSCVLAAFVSVLLAWCFVPREWSFGDESPARLLSKRELSRYDGAEGGRGLYVAVLGHVFDVHKGHKHYGPAGAYHFMAGVMLIIAWCRSNTISVQ